MVALFYSNKSYANERANEQVTQNDVKEQQQQWRREKKAHKNVNKREWSELAQYVCVCVCVCSTLLNKCGLQNIYICMLNKVCLGMYACTPCTCMIETIHTRTIHTHTLTETTTKKHTKNKHTAERQHTKSISSQLSVMLVFWLQYSLYNCLFSAGGKTSVCVINNNNNENSQKMHKICAVQKKQCVCVLRCNVVA